MVSAHFSRVLSSPTTIGYYCMYLSIFPGLVGITCNLGYSEPSNLDDPTSVEAADRSIQFDLGWFAHPILVDREYPQVMRDMVGSFIIYHALTEKG